MITKSHLFLLLCVTPTILCQSLIEEPPHSENDFAIPTCGPSIPALVKKRHRIAFISHDAVISTFYHNPEQGSRDAANIVDIDVEWNRYLTTTESKMAQDIRHATDDSAIDGIITSIPNQASFEAIQYALSKKVPLIVFNSGLQYAQQLGLARVLQDDQEAGLMLGEKIYANGKFTKLLVVQLANMEEGISYLRMKGITSAIGREAAGVLKIADNTVNSTFNPAHLVSETFLKGAYDSVISLGGSVSQ